MYIFSASDQPRVLDSIEKPSKHRQLSMHTCWMSISPASWASGEPCKILCVTSELRSTEYLSSDYLDRNRSPRSRRYNACCRSSKHVVRCESQKETVSNAYYISDVTSGSEYSESKRRYYAIYDIGKTDIRSLAHISCIHPLCSASRWNNSWNAEILDEKGLKDPLHSCKSRLMEAQEKAAFE